MLRKNNLDRVRSNDRCTVSCQTEQFLLYVSMEQKLESVYGEYRALMSRYKQAQQHIQFLQHKNAYLQSSLFNMSVTYNHKMSNSNIRRIEEIKNLEETISKESKELQNIHQISGIHKPCSHKTAHSLLQDQQKRQQPSTSKSEFINTAREKNTQSEVEYKKIENGAKPYYQNQESQISLEQSKNQFLPMPSPTALRQIQQKINCQTQRYEDKHNLFVCQKPITYRHSPKKQKSQSKRRSTNKENINYEKLVKIEAEIKMKQFMSKFKINSNQNSQFGQGQDMFCDQLDMLKLIETQGNKCLRNIR